MAPVEISRAEELEWALTGIELTISGLLRTEIWGSAPGTMEALIEKREILRNRAEREYERKHRDGE